MTPETLVVSRELCEQMDEAGIKFPDSYFVWTGFVIHDKQRWEIDVRDRAHGRGLKFLDAPTLGELLESLPNIESKISILTWLKMRFKPNIPIKEICAKLILELHEKGA